MDIQDKMYDGTATNDEILDWLDPSSNYPAPSELNEMANEIMAFAANRTLDIGEANFEASEPWSEIARNLSRRYEIAADLYLRAEEQGELNG